ncbi:hypothetical protein BHM03_00003651 [Ensete ventricosum]|nr:hypothetical protein BHM03_00003651 [Ensete ventricosum]
MKKSMEVVREEHPAPVVKKPTAAGEEHPSPTVNAPAVKKPTTVGEEHLAVKQPTEATWKKPAEKILLE